MTATPNYPRDKDADLAAICSDTAAAATEGVEWLARHREPGPHRDSLQKSLRRQAVEARRLANAALRPMSVGVFGASQMGKSFLIGKLIKPSHSPAHVVFGQGDAAVRQDFLEQVNPAGGDETTGLVTRFSIRREETPPGYPVALRPLREVDIVKILANTFLFDCKGQYRIQTGPEESDIDDRRPTPAAMAGLADQVHPQSSPQPGIRIEDVYELREYFEKSLPDHALAQEEYEGYWRALESLLPRLGVDGRLKLLGPLWADLEEFSDLYRRLKGALDQLGHPDRMFTSLVALADRNRGVLHVNTLSELDAKGPTQTLSVVSRQGVVTLETCVVTALTAELCVTLETKPWPFFAHTDLLDFPGARSREAKPVHEFLRAPTDPTARSKCYLRGKVAVLFDNYAADLDLNVMVLCSGPENQEVKSLPGLVQDWVTRTHGDTPERRQGRPVGLFYCLTKCDLLFVRRVGNEAPVGRRMEKDTRPYGWWMTEWTPGKPFDNMFLIRNPGIMNPGMFCYDDAPANAPADYVPPERALDPEFVQGTAGDFRAAFLAEPLVRQHIADPERKLDELLALNDGGTTYLAQALAPVCDQDLKYAQIAPRAHQAQQAVYQSLAGYHVSGNLEERLAKRLERINRLIMKLRGNKGQMIGPFIASFQIDDALMEAAYRQYRRSMTEAKPEEDVFAIFDGDEDQPDRTPAPHGYGAVLVDWWAEHLVSKVAGNIWCSRLDLDEETLRGFVEEIVAGAERRDVARLLEQRIDGFTINGMALDAAAHRVSIFAGLTLNDEVNFPGGRDDATNGARFRPLDSQGDPTALLTEDPGATGRMRLLYFKEWMDALQDLTRLNASSSAGRVVDVVANERLSRILKLLGRSIQ
ncbi:hypothetical protein PY32053_03282 [Paracoccus yeei]|uniref:Virulence factor n=1 Tax=Paracoccus yeei TaxID=147645 RepID=A0A386UR40_9RHOB|nr:virulence factor SrfC family protein [Paracoccus yeei]AYF02856.1 hypothetical protein PY32053_03282 [Paracoccus yeei]